MLSPGKALARRPRYQAGGWFPRARRSGQTNLSAGAGEGQPPPAHRYVGAVWCLQGRPRTCAFALSCPSPLSSPASVCTSSLSRCRSLQKDLGGSRCFPAPLHPASALGRAGTVGVEGRVLGTAFALGASKCPLPFCGREGKTQLPAPGAQPGPKPGPPPPPARCGWQSRTNTNKPRLFHFPCPHQSEEQIHVFGHSWVTGLLGTETPSF